MGPIKVIFLRGILSIPPHAGKGKIFARERRLKRVDLRLEMTKKPLKCWALSDGRQGMAHQALGLAQALGVNGDVQVTAKAASLAGWVGRLPEALLVSRAINPLAHLTPQSDELSAERPDIIVGCGRHAMALSVAIKRKANRDGHEVFIIQTQDPRAAAKHFDVVVPPAHDDLIGPNVIPTLGAVNHATTEKLHTGADTFAAKFKALPRPLVAVLIGGTSHAYTLDADACANMARTLKALQQETGCGFVVTMSRRTGTENEKVLREALTGDGTWIWDGKDPNPYFGMLGLADHIFVTTDSTNMITEAAATGKPIHVLNLPGGNAKFRRFMQSLRARGIARPFGGTLKSWAYEPLAEASRVAALIRRKLELDPSSSEEVPEAAE